MKHLVVPFGKAKILMDICEFIVVILWQGL